MIIEVSRGIQSIPVIQSGVASGLLWSVEHLAMLQQDNFVLRVYFPRLYRHIGGAQWEDNWYSTTRVAMLLPSAAAGSRDLQLCRLWEGTEKLRIPETGWVEFDYCDHSTLAGDRFWRVVSGFSPVRCSGHWLGMRESEVLANIRPAASHVCRELRTHAEVACW